LEAIDGFDVRYRSAGDDVDLCWRLQEAGGKIAFHAGAMVWHHRRNSVRTYGRQQRGYGKAEALLEEKWPERYNAAGHLRWAGRLYGRGFTEPLQLRRSRIYHGTWGTAAYQSVYEPHAGTLLSLPLMPEWYMVIGFLCVLGLLGLFWPPLLLAVLPFALLAMAAPLAQAVVAATSATYPIAKPGTVSTVSKRILTAVLHLMQPAARLIGRYQHGLLPWRHRGHGERRLQRPKPLTLWSEEWHAQEEWVERLESAMRAEGAIVSRGGDFDHWDLRVRGGLLGSAVATIAIEEHGSNRQLVRLRTRGVVAPLIAVVLLAIALLGSWAATDGAPFAAGGLFAIVGVLIVVAARDIFAAAGTVQEAAETLVSRDDAPTED
jgi:hypothetical protein